MNGTIFPTYIVTTNTFSFFLNKWKFPYDIHRDHLLVVAWCCLCHHRLVLNLWIRTVTGQKSLNLPVRGENNPPTVGDIVRWAGHFELSEREGITLSIHVYMHCDQLL